MIGYRISLLDKFISDMQEYENIKCYGYKTYTKPDEEYDSIEKLNELFSEKEKIE